ncbi:hypothetical protein [Lactobacillus johnsonii]|uniref:YolD-like family protein n=1 Tax=Lactobacillus johnsonii TaxID=33959 RepID=A0A9X6NZR8_LACJH|nr:hypothetical protein [Lactobacillus johnsonii]OYS01586.1 hypothetical protein CBF54_08720 [Lactobacillus johnsonii]OYS06195.1 hypothetical protein CBF62_07530 [Lactobacillus johnsonii]OYS06590.1 hypothetical protein CBF63_08825 [Lactobacillus johnsonii]OYS06684.1 hypothetical protein CBF65_08330 [Lactobacillus johnsonii]OYS12178.1 hypothetical protein CBF48_06755 [Lactobacillus johnsonii]
MNLLKSLNNYSKQLYNYFFKYNINKLTTFAQDPSKIIRILEHALFHKEYILLTYQNGCTEIGQLIKRTSAGRFVLDSYDSNIIRIIDLNEIFNVETA